mgnify:CR=1 FL=1
MERINILSEIPLNSEGKNIFKIRNENDLLLAVVHLKKGHSIPKHHANAKVSVLVFQGSILSQINGETQKMNSGDIITLEKGTEMEFVNSDCDLTILLLIKSPNPGVSLK